MKRNIQKIGLTILALVFIMVIYYTPTVSTWRSYNNGIREFKAGKFDQAANNFKKAMARSPDVILSYNWVISTWKALEEKNDKKVNAIKDEIEECQKELSNLLSNKELPDSLITKALYIRGKLLVMDDNIDGAKKTFNEILEKQRDFRLALLELVQLRVRGSQEQRIDPETQLLISLTPTESVSLVENYKPF